MTFGEKLSKTFPDSEIEWRCQNAGAKGGKKWAQVVPFIQSRAIYQRLDEVVGPANWQTTYRETNVGGEDGMICGIGINIEIGDGEWQWVWKFNGAGCGTYEPIKAGCSNSIKRAAVEWGIGRYLYQQTKQFVDVMEGYPPDDGGHYVNISQKQKGDRPAIYGYAVAPSQRLGDKVKGAQTLPGRNGELPGMAQRSQQGPPDHVPPPDDRDAPPEPSGKQPDGFPAKYDTCCSICGEWHETGTRITKHGENNKGGQGYAAVACIEKELKGGRQ